MTEFTKDEDPLNFEQRKEKIVLAREEGRKQGIEEGSIRAYQLLLDLNIGNCETHVWLRTQINLLKELEGKQ